MKEIARSFNRGWSQWLGEMRSPLECELNRAYCMPAAALLETLTMDPWMRASFIARAAARLTRKVPLRFTPITESNTASVASLSPWRECHRLPMSEMAAELAEP